MDQGETNQSNRCVAPVFNIVNGSFVDGYGIRTTIFLQGCPLKCKWCCNPEGQKFTQKLQFLKAHCNQCGKCIQACPHKAIKKIDDKITIDWNLCNDCGKCISSCWQDALKFVSKMYTAEEIFEKVLREKPYFDQSNGGVTIGGGEATCYPEFCLRLIELCHDADIKVAIDTCGYLASNGSKRVLKMADLLLFDIKGMDEKQHIQNTGVSNASILRIFKELSLQEKPMIVRVPIIPSFNDSEKELEAIAAFLETCSNVERVDLMPYHEYGRNKYEELGIKDSISGKLTYLSEKRLNEDLELFRKYHLNVQIGG